MEAIISNNKTRQLKSLTLESLALNDKIFLSIIKEHSWLEELIIKQIDISLLLDEKKIQQQGNNLNKLLYLQISQCNLEHLPSYICEASTESSKGNKQVEIMHNIKRQSISAQKALVDMYGSCWQHTLTCLDLSCNSLSSLPSSIVQLVSLQTLVLSMNNYSTLPKNVTKIRTLTDLNLKGNKISKLEDATFHSVSLKSLLGTSKKNKNPICRSLRTLNLSHNSLVHFPEALANLTVLHELDLSHNIGIRNTIDRDGILGSWSSSIQMLNLDNCGLLEFPSQITQLANLRHIHLSQNSIRSIPKLGNLPYLNTLTIASCKIEDLSPIFPQKMLRKINACHNNIKSIPALSIHSSNVLEELLLTNNKLSILGSELACYSSLTLLDCCHNNISSVDASLGELKNLKYLNLSHNKISALDDNMFSNLKNLRMLSLSHNNLSTVPSLNNCTKLQKFYAKSNNLKTFPDFGAIAGSFVELDLSYNMLSQIHPCLYECALLEILELSCNQLLSLEPVPLDDNTKDVSHLYSLKKLKIDGNGLSELPAAISSLKNIDTLRISFHQPLPEEQLEWIKRYNITLTNTFTKPKQIEEYLFIGARDTISNLHYLETEHNISHVLNLCSRKVNSQLERFQVLSKNESMDEKDSPVKLVTIFKECCDFIHKAVSAQQKCLIVCDDSKFLSPMMYIAYCITQNSGAADLPAMLSDVQKKSNEKFTHLNKFKMESMLRVFDRHIHPSFQDTLRKKSDPEMLDPDNAPFIKTLLSNDRTRAYFKEFCIQERSVENIGFWEEVELRYKRIQDGLQRYAFARKIFEAFIESYEAPYQLNIDQKLIDEVESQLDAFAHLESILEDNSKDEDYKRMSLAFPPHTFFDDLVPVVERLMLDTAQRFMKSELYLKMQNDDLKKGPHPEVSFLLQASAASIFAMTGN